MIRAIILWNIWSFCMVEVLSAFRMLNKVGLVAGWCLLNSFLLIRIVVKLRSQNERLGLTSRVKKWADMLWKNKLPALTAVIVLGLAVVTVPYNWDAMTYHLPRIVHWAQNNTVAHFATNDIRQLSSPVLAEFINVQVYLLTGQKDNLLNLLQACSYMADAWFVYKIAVKIGCQRKSASLAALLFMTMPTAFGEALNMQVDLFSTMWLLMFVYKFIDIYEADSLNADKRNISICMEMGLCIAFGYLAKPSVNIGMAILLFFLLVKCIRRRDKLKELIKLLLCTLPVVLLLLLPEGIRNYQTFAALSDPVTGARQLVGTIRPNYLLVNLLKNFAQNWPNIYLYDSAEWMAKLILVIAGVLQVDINDPGIAEDGMEYVMQEAPSYNHDTAINPVVVILATVFFVWSIKHIRKKRKTGDRYAVWVMVLFVTFCGMVRWQSFVNRYMISYLALLCPMIGWLIQRFVEECKVEGLRNAVMPIVYFLCITELFSLSRYHQELWHENASVRPDGYFANNKEIKQEYLDTLSWVKSRDCRKIGVKLSGINYEYPIWYILEMPGTRIEHVMVENASGIYMDQDYVPDCILLDAGLAEEGEVLKIGNTSYRQVEQFAQNKRMCVYLAETE